LVEEVLKLKVNVQESKEEKGEVLKIKERFWCWNQAVI
jgi:hypothetical protein